MKISKDIVLREIAGEHILVPVGEAAARFQGMMTLNDTGLFLWELLQEEHSQDELVQALVEEYDVDAPTARADVEAFLQQLQKPGILLE